MFNPDDAFYTAEQGVNNLKEVLGKWLKTYPNLQSTVNRDDLNTVFTYLNFDYRIRRMIYTTNWAAITLMGYVSVEMEEKNI